MWRAADALARTVLLVRDVIRAEVPDSAIVEALMGARVTIVADRENVMSEEGQHALVTTALLIARSGARVQLCIADVPLLGAQAPLDGDRLLPALHTCLADLIPGVEPIAPESIIEADLIVLIGDSDLPSPARAKRVVRICGDAWAGQLCRGTDGAGERWQAFGSPFGALAAAGHAAAEAFKMAIHPLRQHAYDPQMFDEQFAFSERAELRLAPAGTSAPRMIFEETDAISAGAIIQSALYALARVPGAHGKIRLIEPETSDVTNLNRYALLRVSRLGRLKAMDVGEQAGKALLGDLEIEALPLRYDDDLSLRLGNEGLAPHVLVGVDDIPTRWRVQSQWPRWLGVGATSHWSAMLTTHTPSDTGCAACAHPYNEAGNGPIPTVSFVSHWAGLWLAARFAQRMSGIPLNSGEQSIYMSPLRVDRAGVWRSAVARHPACPVHTAC
jgi:hypothetical protein